MRVTIRLLVAVCGAALLLVPAASAADRMWIGFHDDPILRFDGGRLEAFDRAQGNNAVIVRTLVEWSKTAPTKPANPTDPFDKAYRFDDLDEFVRNAQARGMEVLITLWGTPSWANGNQTPQALPTKMADFQAFAANATTAFEGDVPALDAPPATGYPVCERCDADPDGDRWGWEHDASCRVGSWCLTPEFPPCAQCASDPDGDGWGWEHQRSCVVMATCQ